MMPWAIARVMTDTAGVSVYQYDALDRLTHVSQPTGALTYTYDLNGNRTGISSIRRQDRHHLHLRRRQSPDHRHRLGRPHHHLHL